jgi:hypothetical protein
MEGVQQRMSAKNDRKRREREYGKGARPTALGLCNGEG